MFWDGLQDLASAVGGLASLSNSANVIAFVLLGVAIVWLVLLLKVTVR